ncbi:MAG: hypothetical protein HKN94_08115 [Acidimicrobiales bacterium]|nr:hypothetical protein [Acidimicrobiales bacterium]
MRIPIVITILTAAMLAVVSNPATASSAGGIDTTDRQAVLASYLSSVEDATRIHHRWTGDADVCDGGQTSAQFKTATVSSINWFRAMSGLDAVSLDATSSTAAQAAAVMMHAEAALDHYPASDWSCYSASGAASAGLSNLTLGVAGPRGIVAQMEDPGASNSDLGHRRWLMYSRLDRVGVGNTSWASAISVIDGIGAEQPGPTWVSWPPHGYTPNDMVFPRWSLSHTDGADFSNATVSMTRNGKPVNVKLLPVATGFGDATLGWEPLNADPVAGFDTVYEVAVSGITTSSGPVSHRYQVVAFDAAAPAGGSFEDHTPKCRSQVATIVGSNLSETIQGTPGDDVIVALGGNDVIYGGGGNDIICAGNGNDVVHAGGGRDVVLGGRGHDTIRGGAGDDRLDGQTGRDRLSGNQGNDELIGGPQRDVISGNTGSDLCRTHRPGLPSTNEPLRTCER